MLMKCSIKLIIHYTSACGNIYLMGNILGLVACFRVLHLGIFRGITLRLTVLFVLAKTNGLTLGVFEYLPASIIYYPQLILT